MLYILKDYNVSIINVYFQFIILLDYTVDVGGFALLFWVARN